MPKVEKHIEVSSVNPVNLPYTQWWEEAQELDLRHVVISRWVTATQLKYKTFDIPDCDIKGSSFAGTTLADNSADVVFLWKNKVLVRVYYSNYIVGVFIAAKSHEAAKETMEWLRKLFVELKPKENDDEKTMITFWYHAPAGGGSSYERILDTPRWEDIRRNYTLSVRDEIDKLMDDSFRPAHGGQLILWQGPAGTGKTTAIRALSSKWRKWCKAAYIIDPDMFFYDANYMLQTILFSQPADQALNAEDIIELAYDMPEDVEIEDISNDLGTGYEAISIPENKEEKEEPKDKDWVLIILEDCGELVASDAKVRTNQAFSRLLNITDGLLGQGLKVLLLLTTNEEVKDLHEAVSRPGRCASHIVFPQLTADESNAWLDDHGSKERVTTDKSLSELYGILENFRTELDKKAQTGKMGFRTNAQPTPAPSGGRTIGFGRN